MKKRFVLPFFSAVGIISLVASTASAALIVYEPFDYTVGSAIIGQTNTYSPGSPVWNQTVTGTPAASVHQAVSGSLSGPNGYPTNIGNSGDMLNGDFAEIPRLNLPQQYGPSSTLYYSLLLDVPDVAGLTIAHTNVNANNDLLIAFNNSTGTVQDHKVGPANW